MQIKEPSEEHYLILADYFNQKRFLQYIDYYNQILPEIKALESSQQLNLKVWLATSYRMQKNYTVANQLFEALLLDSPETSHGLQGLIDNAMQQKDWQKALDYCEQFYAKFPNDWRVYYWKGQSHKELYQYDRAENQFYTLIERFPELSKGYEGLVATAQHQKDWAKVIKRALVFQKKFEQLAPSYIWLGIAYIKNKQYYLAELQLKRLLELTPKNFQGLDLLINSLQAQNKYLEILQITEKYEQIFENNWHLYFWQTRAKTYLKNQQTLLLEFQYIVQHYSSITLGYELKANLYLYTQQYEALLAISNQLISLFPSAWQGYYYQGLYFSYLNNIEKAYQLFKQAIHLSPMQISIYQAMLEVVSQQNDRIQLVKLCKQCQERFKEQWLGFSFIEKSYFKEQKNNYLDYIKNKLIIEETCQQLILREKEIFITNRFSNDMNFDEKLSFATILIHNHKLEQAHNLLDTLLPEPSQVSRLEHAYCLLYFAKKQWHTVIESTKRYQNEYPHEIRLVFHMLLVALCNIRAFDEVKQRYIDFCEGLFLEANIAIDTNILLFQGKSLTFDGDIATFSKRHFLAMPQPFSIKEDYYINQYINDIDNEILFIGFSGIDSTCYRLYDSIKDIEATILGYNNRLASDFINYPYKDFAQAHPFLNVISVIDSFGSGHIINLAQTLQVLQRHIDFLQPKYIVCSGGSAGGFGSLVYANLLRADMVFSFAPREAFCSSFWKFPRKLQEVYNITQPELTNLASLQQLNHGFIPKTYITLAENEPLDMLTIHNLDISDSNLSISYCYGDSHNPQGYLGNDRVLNEIIRIIKKERAAKFGLSLQADYLQHIQGFKYNTLQPDVIQPLQF